MRRIDVEEWAFRVLERVKRGQSKEDTLVELKSNWPSARDIARQLGGHANSARSQPVLWLFGVDEREGVVEFEPQDTAAWRDQLNREFDGFAPRFDHYDLEWEGRSFSAFAFETDAAPYVVLNPKRNETGAGPFDREVPWREGRTRSAKRAELILSVRPPARLPIIEVVSGRVTVTHPQPNQPHNWDVGVELYGVSQSLERMFLPFFGLQAYIATSSGEQLEFERCGINSSSDDPHVTYVRNHQLVIDGAGRFRFYGALRTEALSQDLNEPLTVAVRLKVAGNDLPITLSARLCPTADRHQFMAAWSV